MFKPSTSKEVKLCHAGVGVILVGVVFACGLAWPGRPPAEIVERLIFLGVLAAISTIAIVGLGSYVKLYRRYKLSQKMVWLLDELDEKVFPPLYEAIRENDQIAYREWKASYIRLHGGIDEVLTFYLQKHTLPGLVDGRTSEAARKKVEAAITGMSLR